MRLQLQTERERETLERVAEGWEAIPSCYREGFEVWLSQHFEDILKYYGSTNLEVGD